MKTDAQRAQNTFVHFLLTHLACLLPKGFITKRMVYTQFDGNLYENSATIVCI